MTKSALAKLTLDILAGGQGASAVSSIDGLQGFIGGTAVITLAAAGHFRFRWVVKFGGLK